MTKQKNTMNPTAIQNYNAAKHRLFFLQQYRQIILAEITGTTFPLMYTLRWSCILRDNNDVTKVAKIWMSGTSLMLDSQDSIPTGYPNPVNILFDASNNSFWNDAKGIVVGTGDLRDLALGSTDLSPFLLQWAFPVESDGNVDPIYIENTAVFELNIYSKNSPSKLNKDGE